MTADLTIPAAVWACKVDGVPLVAGIVEGGCPIGCAYDGTGRGKHGMFCSAAGSKPPVDLVALRDARCETCGGEGRRWIDGRWLAPKSPMQGRESPYIEPCPNDRCVDGRLLHDVRVECGHTDEAHLDPELPHCPSYRTVRCLVDVVPVVDVACPGRTNDRHRPAHLHVSFDDAVGTHVENSDLIWDSPWHSRNRLTPAHVEALAAACGKPPTDWVGMWAVVLTEVGA